VTGTAWARLSKIFEHDEALLVFYSQNYFEHQSLGAVTHYLPQPESECSSMRSAGLSSAE